MGTSAIPKSLPEDRGRRVPNQAVTYAAPRDLQDGRICQFRWNLHVLAPKSSALTSLISACHAQLLRGLPLRRCAAKWAINKQGLRHAGPSAKQI